MDNEVYTFALKSTLDEIQNVYPEITNTFMFKEDGEIIVGDKNTPEKAMVKVIDSFDGILEKGNVLGGVECITLKGSKGRLSVSHLDDIYLVTVTSEKADMKYVNTVTRVMVPTILKLLEKICSAPFKSNSPTQEIEPKISINEEVEETLPPEIKQEPNPEKLLPELPINQLIVENLGGLLVPSDTVRIDSDILSQWENIYEGKKIEEVEIETFDGKTTKCKVKPIKDSKYAGKGIIQMPEKVQLTLEIKKGELVKAKPVIE